MVSFPIQWSCRRKISPAWMLSNSCRIRSKKGSELYSANEYEAGWRYYIRRGQESIDKYSAIANNNDIVKLESAIFDRQPMIQFADEAWTAWNAFKDALRNFERQEDRIKDNRLSLSPEKARFGR